MKGLSSLILLFISFNIYSQDTIVVLNREGAKKIATELIECDYIKKELILTEKLVTSAEEKIKLKDMIIEIFEKERKMVDSMLLIKDEQLKVKQGEIDTLTKINERERTKKTVNKIIYGLAGLGAGYLIFK